MTEQHDALVKLRQRLLGPAYSHFYEEPLHLVRGEGVWLYDVEGRRYLDCYNNVPSVGHCHPHVVQALSRQAALLNTHTRYLHHEVLEYAERLTATLPGDLSVCTFVCTGTEANDLAYRMACAATGREGTVFTRGAYHGNSTLVAALSRDYDAAHPAPPTIAQIEPPYTYRGRYSTGHPDVWEAYAALWEEGVADLDVQGHQPAMLLIDSIFDGRGILTPEPAYLQSLYARARAAGAVVVADEVQAGLCRLGDHWWGFMDSAVVPDIVTVGKPMGDGHPVAAVITTPAIAEAFAGRSGYFNTFGGNPVSAAVGNAVLDVVENEGLLQNVHQTGNQLRAGLDRLAESHDLIGEVRGKGLFLGLELVADRHTRAPAPQAAHAVVETMRESGVLVSAVGEHGNIIKLRPPLVLQPIHVELALQALDHAVTRASQAPLLA